MSRKRTRISHCKPGNTRITHSDMKYECVDDVARMYVNTIESNKNFINSKLDPFYGRILNLPENILGDVVNKIKNIEKETGKSMPEIAEKIRSFLGEDTSFYISVEGRSTPICSDKILKAFKAIEGGYSQTIVRRSLYS